MLGSNGAGKSTLCGVAAGLITPTRGTVALEGEDVTDWPAYRRAAAGIMLTPEARGVFPGLSVEENLSVWLPSPADRDRAYEHFAVLGERRHQRAGLLSGGEQQILALDNKVIIDNSAAEAALAAGNFTAYGAAEAKVQQDLQALQKLLAQQAPSPSP